MSKPLAIDLFCGLGGWAEGFLAEGWDVIGFDIERHDYGTGGYPGQLVLQDVLTLDGRQFRKAAVIVASPPCQAYSYMAMPWSRAKELVRLHREDVTRQLALNCLFNSCFRIAQEAGVPLVVENVKGAQPWVGRARAHFGSFYFWGDIDSVGNQIVSGKRLQFGSGLKAPKRGGSKNNGGSWFAIGSPGRTKVGQNPDGRKVPVNFHEHDKTGKPGRSFQSVAVEGLKGPGGDWFKDGRQGQDACALGIKNSGLNWSDYGDPEYRPKGFNVTNAQRWRDEQGVKNGADTRDERRRLTTPFEGGKGMRCGGKNDYGGPLDPRRFSSRGDSRKAASAQIAKIPFPLAQYIARVFKPTNS